ncbi:MAG: class I SAM-dependent methyltransferase [Pseudomonadota bacterium]
MHNVDWNAAWQEARKRKKHNHRDNSHWNRRAASFAQHTKNSLYSEKIVHHIRPSRDWSVLDVGCGAGTLAIPLAKLVRRVTAIDFSDTMIALLNDHCLENGLTNVTTRVIGWEDDWGQADIDKHDVAIASRSLIVDDLQAALCKLNSKARRRVFLSSLVGDGPCDRKIFEAIGRDLDRGPDFIYIYNMLHQMGIHADISFIQNGDGDKVYRDLDDAVEKIRWMIDAMTPEEGRLLQRYLEKHLIKKQGGWAMSYKHIVRWAIISWSKRLTC